MQKEHTRNSRVYQKGAGGPYNIYLFKVNNRNPRQNVKHVQS